MKRLGTPYGSKEAGIGGMKRLGTPYGSNKAERD